MAVGNCGSLVEYSTTAWVAARLSVCFPPKSSQFDHKQPPTGVGRFFTFKAKVKSRTASDCFRDPINRILAFVF